MRKVALPRIKFRYEEFLDYHENKLDLFGKKQARIISLTTRGINKAESILTIKSKNV